MTIKKYYVLMEDFLKASRAFKVSEIFFSIRYEDRPAGDASERWAILKLTALIADTYFTFSEVTARTQLKQELLEAFYSQVGARRDEVIQVVQKELPSTFLIEGEIQP